MSVDTLDEAMALYLCHCERGFPCSHADEVRDAYGEPTLQRILSLLIETNDIPLDGDAASLAEAGQSAVQAMADKYPDLSRKTLELLFWNYTWTWR